MAPPRILVALVGFAALAAPAPGYRLGGARLVRAAQRALAEHARGSARAVDLRDASRGLPDAAALASTESERNEVRRLRRRLADAAWEAAFAEGHGPAAIEALEGWLRLHPNDPEASTRIAATISVGDDHDAARALERVFLDRSLPESTRDRAAEALAPLRWDLSGGAAGRDLGALAWLLDQWLPHYAGPDRGRMLALGGDVAQHRRESEKAMRRYRQAASLGALTRSQQRQLQVLETMRDHRHAGTLVEAAPDARFSIEVGARVGYRQAEAIRGHFERAYTDWAARFGFAPRENLLVRVLVEDDLDRVLSPHIEGLTEAAGILLRIRPGETAADLAAVSRHEYVHFALERMAGAGRLPRWLHEGIATWFEEQPLRVSLYRRLLAARQQGRFPSAGDLSGFRAANVAGYRCLYDTAALLVERRVHAGGDGALQRLVEAIGAGRDVETTWRRQTGRTLQEATGELAASLLELVRDRIRMARGDPAPPPDPDAEPGLVLEGEGRTIILQEDEGPGLELLPFERHLPRPRRATPAPRRDDQGRLRRRP